MQSRKYFFYSVIVLAGFIAAFFSGYFLNSYFEPEKYQFPLVNQAYNILINHAYLDLPSASILEHGMIRGLLDSSGDQYASFQEPIQKELESNSLQGSFGGIGVEFTRTEKGELLLYPIRGGPAYEAGIQDGDQLLQVEELKITPEMGDDEITAALRGPVENKIRLKILRKGHDAPLEFSIKRELIHLPSVTWHLAPEDANIGIITVHIIAESTAGEIQDAVNALQIAGADRFILDLRDNGGGLLTAGIETARLFLNKGVIVEEQYRGQEVTTYSVNTPGPLADLSLAILINQNTASAAEILAGALQSHERAVLLGEPSFGKDSIQLIFDLQDGSSMHITAAKWWIPDLNPPIGESGLQPDILITQEISQIDSIMNAAIEFIMGQ
jgi:carboxyl-terminal processing protease